MIAKPSNLAHAATALDKWRPRGGTYDTGRRPPFWWRDQISGSRKGVASHRNYGVNGASKTLRPGEIADMKIARLGNDSDCYISVALTGRYQLDYRSQQSILAQPRATLKLKT